MKKHISIIVATVFLLAIQLNSFAQGCSMCKQVAKTSAENGSDVAQGINTGILYLMAIPYVILMFGGYLFFKKPIDEKLKELKEKYYFPKKI